MTVPGLDHSIMNRRPRERMADVLTEYLLERYAPETGVRLSR